LIAWIAKHDFFEHAGCFTSAAPKEKKMKRNLSLSTGLLGAGLLACALLPALAQTPAQTPAPAGTTGKVHGHVTNPTGAPQAVGSVSLSTDGGRTSKYTFPVSASGDYTGDVAPGTYTVVFRQPDTPPDKMVDSFDNVKVLAGQDTAQDIDMSRKAFIDKLPPEQQKQLEELRKHNSEAMKANEVIKALNADLKITTQDIKDADAAHATAVQTLGAGAAKADIDAKELEIKTAKYTEIETLMLKDTGLKPDASILWAQLGQAQVGLKKYDDAAATFKKTIELESAAKAPKPQILGLANSGLGEVYARTGKIQEANDAYDAAAKINPTQAGFYLKNEAVIFFQTNQGDAQVAAADKAIAVDPNSAVLYYLKGNGLVQKTTMDPKTNKLVAPPGCMEAYQKYLQLAPDGPYAAEVKGILQGFNQTVDTSYKAPKKK
jgi:tetratricopeptide (TPR) repeat protein